MPLVGPMQGTGMWRDLCPWDAIGFVFGTDGSGGPASSYKLHRLCSWAVAALEACPPHNVVATLRGPLPGTKQTVPLAEAHAMKVLLAFTDGPLTMCADSLGCVKRLRRIRAQTPITIEKWSNPAMWLHIKQLVGSREVHVAWLPSHQQRRSGQEDWQFKANQLADQIAGDVAQSRARVALLDVRVQILDVVYDRCWRIQSALIQHYAFWHGTMQGKPLSRMQGPKEATKAEIVQYAPQTSTTDSFQLCTRGSSVSCRCLRCGLLLQASWRRARLLQVMRLPCSFGWRFQELGIHASHEPFVDGTSIRCRQCKRSQHVHSFVSMNKFQNWCRGSR